jgi:hypothetical protein
VSVFLLTYGVATRNDAASADVVTTGFEAAPVWHIGLVATT